MTDVGYVHALVTEAARLSPAVDLTGAQVVLRDVAADLDAMVRSWRANKAPDAWPWQSAISGGHARIEYLQGIVFENYHYVSMAPWRQVPASLGSYDDPAVVLMRQFIFEEAAHGSLFADALRRWGRADWVTDRRPLPHTRLFCEHLRSVALEGPITYFASSAVLEVNPDVYQAVGDPYLRWAEIYQFDPQIVQPVSDHLSEDAEAGHAGNLTILSGSVRSIPTATAKRLYEAAWDTLAAQHAWQEAMYRHYHLAQGEPLARL